MHRDKSILKVAFAAGKGGVGKTTLSGSVGSYLADCGYKVLMVDLNSQSDLTYGLNQNIEAPGIGQYLMGESETPHIQKITDNLHIINGGDGLNHGNITSGAISYNEYGDFLEEMKGLGYEIVITDIPPEKGVFEKMGINTADAMFLVMNKHPFSKRNGMKVLQEVVDRQRRNRVAPRDVNVVLNNVARIHQSDETLTQLRNKLNEDEYMSKFSVSMVHKDVKIDRPMEEGNPLMSYKDVKAMSPVIEEIGALASWLLAKSSIKH